MKKWPAFFISVFITANVYAQSNLQDSHIACSAYKSPLAYLDTILKRPQRFIQYSETGCVYKLLDTLTSLSIKGNQGALASLDKLYQNSDGDVSEYFLDIGVKLFYDGFDNTVEYLFKNSGSKKDNTLESAIVEALSMQVSGTSNKEKERKKIHAFIVKKEQELNLTAPYKEYLSKLEREINPEMFD